MPHDSFWQWHFWFFPTFMPILWFVIMGLCLYFIFSRRWARKPGYPEKTLRQRGNQ
jgi:threonine/homoserine/homoserine lactone efflux protein